MPFARQAERRQVIVGCGFQASLAAAENFKSIHGCMRYCSAPSRLSLLKFSESFTTVNEMSRPASSEFQLTGKSR